MNLRDYKLVLISVGIIGVLLIATPAMFNFISAPNPEPLSELYILGPEHMASNYPFNIVVGQNYSVFVDVSNHLGSSAYYILYLKLLNQTDTLPNAKLGTLSPIKPFYEYRFIVQNNQIHESRLNFSFSVASIDGSQSIINKIIINENIISVEKPSVFNTTMTIYPYQLLMELCIYNNKSNSFEYHTRSVHLLLNLTSSPFAS